MVSGRTVHRYLRNLAHYLGQFGHHQSTYFEQLIGQTFARMLYLPFYREDNDDPNVRHRVVWRGSRSAGGLSKAPAGGPDIIAYCCGFYLIIEATQKTGANQWTDEFAQAVRHCAAFVRANGLERNNVLIALVTRQLHEDTYRSVRHHPHDEYRFVPLETSLLAEILATSILAFTMRHLDVRHLFNMVPEWVRGSIRVQDFRRSVREKLQLWQKEVLMREKGAFIGVKSYEAMKSIGRAAVGLSEILERLVKHPFVGQYMNVIGEKLSSAEIESILIEQSLGSRAGRTLQTDEALFEQVPGADFRHRALNLVEAVKKIDST